MTKAEERRAFLQAQSATQQPQINTAQSTPTLTKAEQRRLQLQQPAVTQQPVQQPAIQPQYNHGTMAQQGHNQLEQKQANIVNTVTKPMTTYLQNGGKIDAQDTASLAQLAREQGIKEIDYKLGKQKATNQIQMQQQYKTAPTGNTSVKLPQADSPVVKYDKDYGTNEANQVLKDLTITDENQNAGVYLKAKNDLAEAIKNNDVRGIAKNQPIIEEYKKRYDEYYENKLQENGAREKTDLLTFKGIADRRAKEKKIGEEWNRLNLKTIGEQVNGLAQDLEKDIYNFNNATGDRKIQYAKEYNGDLERYQQKLKTYQEALVHDELVNNNPIEDFGKGVGYGATGAVAKGMTYGKLAEDEILDSLGIARNAENIDPNALLKYSAGEREKYEGSLKDIGNGVSQLVPYEENGAGDTALQGSGWQSTAEAFKRLQDLYVNNPEYRRLKNLYEHIANHTYKGTADDLKKELETISREMYQGWKNTHTQAGFDWEEQQQAHNERAYGNRPITKSIVNSGITVGEMIPTIATGQIGIPGASMIPLFMSAAGGSADQAINQGATINQGRNYGALSGATEVGTEMIGGENVNRFLGMKGQSLLSKLFGDSIKNLHIDSKAAKVALNTLFDVGGEMLEEAASEAINPFLQTITYDPNAMPDNMNEYFKDIFNAAVEAIPSTLILEGMGSGFNVVRINRVENELINRINESDLSPIMKNQLVSEVRKASTDVKLGLEESDYIEKRTNEKYSTLQEQLNNVDINSQNNYNIPSNVANMPNKGGIESGLQPTSEPSNEFARLQEESRRMPDDVTKMYHTGERQVDEGVRERLSNVLSGKLRAESSSGRYGNTSLVNPKTGEATNFYTNVDADTFHDNMEIVQKYLRNGDAVTVHNAEDYKNTKNYLSDNGLSGFAITQDGDLISVFNLGKKGFLDTISKEVKENAKTLDCYQSDVQPLADIYNKKLGFKVASLMDFNYDIIAEEDGKDYADYFVKTYGEAPVAFMVNTEQPIETKYFGKDQYQEALDYRNSFLKNDNQDSTQITDTENPNEGSLSMSGNNEIATAPEQTKPIENKTLSGKNLMPTNEELIKQETEKIAESSEGLRNAGNKEVSNLTDIANMTEDNVKMKPLQYNQYKDQNTSKERGFFGNAETSNNISNETKNYINPTTYETKHNLDTLEKVREKLDERGNDMIEEWKTKTKKFTDEDVALGAILIERYQQQGDYKSAARAVEKLADIGTEAGRAVQMYSIFQRLTPETMMLYQQKALNKAFEDMKQKKTGKWVEANKERFQLNEDDIKFIKETVENASQMVDETEKQRELSKIERRINEKLPPDAGDAVKALRRMAMLFNPKTQVRNFAGNATIIPVNAVADFVGTQIDKAVAKKTGIRTTNYMSPSAMARGGEKGLMDAIQDARTGTRSSTTGEKWEFEFGAKPFNEKTGNELQNKINKGLNKLNEALSNIMSGGDRPFREAAYLNSLEGQMKANNVTEPTQEMKDIAANEAAQRTWNDTNSYTKAVIDIRNAMNKINVRGFGLGDLIIPFAKTPANLTKAMVEYSPVGFIPAYLKYNDMNRAISRGEMTAQQQKNFVNSTSKAIAGTLLYAIAGTLAKSGRITGSADKDKDVKNFEQNVLGIQPYSVKFGDKTYTYSWANPINAPLAIMADTYQMSEEDANAWDILRNGFSVAGNVLTENSFLQGISELFGQDSITEGLIQSLESFPESMIPTLISQIASYTDDTRRQTYEYGNDFKTEANKIKYKIPGARNTLEPQVNTFGEEIENQNSFFNVFLNPANVREANITEEQKALYDVYKETKDKTIFPMQAPNYVPTDKGEKQNLSTSDKVKYQKASGQYVTDVYEDLFKSDNFQKESNEAKVKILHEIATDGNAKGKEAVGASTTATNTDLSKLNEKIDILEEADIPLADYYLAWYAKNNHAQGSTYAARQKAIRDYTDLTPEQEETLFEIFNIQYKKGS